MPRSVSDEWQEHEHPPLDPNDAISVYTTSKLRWNAMASISAERLVTHGLFPENLPSVFTTRNIWANLAPGSTTYAVTARAVGEICPYDASKRGGSVAFSVSLIRCICVIRAYSLRTIGQTSKPRSRRRPVRSPSLSSMPWARGTSGSRLIPISTGSGSKSCRALRSA
jgi:hypothetical protein